MSPKLPLVIRNGLQKSGVGIFISLHDEAFIYNKVSKLHEHYKIRPNLFKVVKLGVSMVDYSRIMTCCAVVYLPNQARNIVESYILPRPNSSLLDDLQYDSL